MKSQPKTAYSVRQTAEKLNCGLNWIYAMLYSGKLPASKRGGKWEIPVEAVETRLKQRAEAQ